SKFVNSQAAALAAIVPVALAIGVDPAYIVASAPACYGYYILPKTHDTLTPINPGRIKLWLMTKRPMWVVPERSN
ncbi:hypothetical protein INQ68_26295, partial [Escherichia coli]|nr:hypothetical protein [Escherichia coli]